MSDTMSHFKPLDPGRIDPIDRVELEYWCKELHCTQAQLSEAMSKVGEHITAVREYLAKHY